MKELHQDSGFPSAVVENTAVADRVFSDDAVSFAPDQDPKEHSGGDTTDDAVTELADEEELVDDEVLKEKFRTMVDEEIIDCEEADTECGEEAWDESDLVYDVPRPALTIDEAATILGKSIRAIERSISGKWGNRLPEGWKARRMKIDGESEWRIIPPPSFRVRHSNKARAPRTEMTNKVTDTAPQAQAATTSWKPKQQEQDKDFGDGIFGFTLNSLIQTAGKKAKTELVKAAEYAFDNTMEHPTIVIDRSDDVEKLLRELNAVQRELAEERRMHLEDLRLLAEMQGSMRLLEVKSSQTAVLKDELQEAAKALAEHKRQYQEFLNMPWWKRLFRKSP